MRSFTRTPHGEYISKSYPHLNEKARVFFFGHEATKEAMMRAWKYLDPQRKPEQEEDESVPFMFMQTRGGTFKIVPPIYQVEVTTDHNGNRLVAPYKRKMSLETVSRKSVEDDALEIVSGIEEAYGALTSCTYGF